MTILKSYKNGNAEIELYNDGTRIIQYPDILELDYPLNIDIRVSTRCVFGYNPATGKAVCGFCHESSTTNGVECDYTKLKEKLSDLPRGIELAIGSNEFTDNLYDFLIWCKVKGYVCNLTVNQAHIKRDFFLLKQAIQYGYINGLGVSYRSNQKWDIPEEILEYPNTVFHIIVGIDTVDDILNLKNRGVNKILCLGEKDFGFNTGKVDLNSQIHKEWYWWIPKLFSTFGVVSFDNLALEQLKINRFLLPEQWEEFNQGEHSFYINAVDEYFAPSSRSNEKTDWTNITISEYFKIINK